MIKRLLQVGLILAGFASMPSWAILITTAGDYEGTDVGVVDSFVAATDEILRGEAIEADWINSVLSSDLEYTVKTETVVYYETEETNVFAFDLAPAIEPDYYLIKNSTVTALFENLDDLSWGVFNTLEIVDINGDVIYMNIPSDDFTISHVTSVPEPGMVGLLAIGLLGMVATRRRMKV